MTVKEKAQISFIYMYLSSFLASFVKNIPFLVMLWYLWKNQMSVCMWTYIWILDSNTLTNVFVVTRSYFLLLWFCSYNFWLCVST